jgi:hypothetical protein
LHVIELPKTSILFRGPMVAGNRLVITQECLEGDARLFPNYAAIPALSEMEPNAIDR